MGGSSIWAFNGLWRGVVLTGEFAKPWSSLGVSWAFGVSSPSTRLGVLCGEDIAKSFVMVGSCMACILAAGVVIVLQVRVPAVR